MHCQDEECALQIPFWHKALLWQGMDHAYSMMSLYVRSVLRPWGRDKAPFPEPEPNVEQDGGTGQLHLDPNGPCTYGKLSGIQRMCAAGVLLYAPAICLRSCML